MKNYERLYQTVKRLINDRFSTFDRTISAEQFIEMPVCDQRRYIEKRSGVKVRVLTRKSDSCKYANQEQMDADLSAALS